MIIVIRKDPPRFVEKDDARLPRHDNQTRGPQVLTPDTSRQAPIGTPVLWILVGALAISGAAWVAIGFFAS
jgi:hypothetical protein